MLNYLLRSRNIIKNEKSNLSFLIGKFVTYYMKQRSRQDRNKNLNNLNAAELDLWRRSARRSRWGWDINTAIIRIMVVDETITKLTAKNN